MNAPATEELVDAVRLKLRMVGIREADLDDLAQDVFTIAYRKHEQMPTNPEEARKWLVAIARRCASNLRRARRMTPELVDISILESVPERGGVEPDAVVFLAEVVRAEDRELLIRHHVHGVTLTELGAEWGLSKSMAQKRLADARMRTVEAAHA